jgi:hypothetical protein
VIVAILTAAITDVSEIGQRVQYVCRNRYIKSRKIKIV